MTWFKIFSSHATTSFVLPSFLPPRTGDVRSGSAYEGRLHSLRSILVYIALTFSPNIVTPEPEPHRISRGVVERVFGAPGIEPPDDLGVSRKVQMPFI